MKGFQGRWHFVTASLALPQLRIRNFMLCYLGADYYAFVHRTFLEYFCAGEFVRRFEKTRSLTIEELIKEVFGKHWIDESWHEVLRLIAGMIDATFVKEIIHSLMNINGEEENFINLFLAAECLAEVRNRNVIKSTGKELLSELKKLINYGIYRTSRFSIILNQYFEEDNNRITKIRTQALKIITNTWKDDPDTLTWLKQRATTDDEYV